MSIKLRWLGTACFEMVLPDKQTVIIDPYVDDSVSSPITSDEFEGCDSIFITHGHYDHVLDVGKLADRFNPKIFCSEVTAGSLVEHQGVPPLLINRVKPGDVIVDKGLTVEVVQGVHVDFTKEYKRLTGKDLMDDGSDLKDLTKKVMMSMLGSDQIPDQFEEWMSKYPQGEQLNFFLEPYEGGRIYMAGSYPDPSIMDVAKRAKAHITLLQVPPGNMLNGIEQQVAQVAMASGCKIVVPHHHDPLIPGAKTADLSELKRIFAEKTDMVFKELVPGEWYNC